MDIIKQLIDSIFPDFTEEERKRIKIEYNTTGDRKTTDAWINMPEMMYSRSAICCKSDTFDKLTGAALVLSKLREDILSYRNKKNKKWARYKPWIPRNGELYYTLFPTGDYYTIVEQKWRHNGNCQVNMVDLKNGLMFHTKREAAKYIRKQEMEGRHIVNCWRNYETPKKS